MPLVYSFSEAAGLSPEQRTTLLGGKGASLATMTALGVPVPPGFTITTEACRAYLADHTLPDGLEDAVHTQLAALEQRLGRRLGDPGGPLLVSVRSGAPVSMPGMMDTVLNLGMHPRAVDGLAALCGSHSFAHDTHRRFLECYAEIVLGVDAEVLRAAVEGEADGDGGPAAEAARCEALRAAIAEHCGEQVPADAHEQLWAAIRAVFESWHSPRARAYRTLRGIGEDLGTAVTVQGMVFGNLDARSGTGVAFTRDPNTGEPRRYGDFLPTAQGEEVVSGRAATLPLSALDERLPEVAAELGEIAATLERHTGDACDLEFTVERGVLYLLQSRRAKRAAAAAVRIAVDLANEGLIDRAEAVGRVQPEQLTRLNLPQLDAAFDAPVLGSGLNASPGVASGRICTSADRVAAMASEGPVILVRPETSPTDVHGMAEATGILTTRGGLVSHAAIVARDLGVPAVVGADALIVDPDAGALQAGDQVLAEGETITIDGATGLVVAGEVPAVHPESPRELDTLLSWADELAGADAAPEATPDQRLRAAQSVSA